MTAVLLTATALTAPAVTAQTNYTCFPTCSTTDGRFLSLAGSGIDAFAGNDITIGLGLPPDSTTLQIGIFDGESGGNWDKGTYPLTYKLYADPNGDGTNAVLLDSMSGSVMTDNGWYTYTRAVGTDETAANGNHVYYLHISMPTTATSSTSSFKLRTNGTITVRSYQSFSIHAPIYTLSDANTIYPNYAEGPYSATRYDNPRYNGIWNIYLDVLSPSSELTVWDGDMDFGTDPLTPNAPNPLPVDTDDEDTPTEIPSWAVPAPLTAPEGAAGASPYDDNKSPLNRRSPAVRYDVIFPNSTSYANDNPSGSVEWEQFKISTAPMSRATMDAHADSIPAGIYTVRVEGMDMLNVNAWRFFNDVTAAPGTSDVEVIGVNENGLPVAPIRAIETVSGSISGTVYYDSDASTVQEDGEPGLPTVAVRCYKRNNDGAWSEHAMKGTTIDGNFTFSKLPAGQYKVEVDGQSLQSDVIPTCDADGTTTANTAEITITANSPNALACFGYERGVDVGTLTRGYWVNHPDNWPVNELYIGGTLYQKDALIGILQRPTRGDKSYSMAAQLIATKLNLCTGTNAECIRTEVTAADNWIAANPMGNGRTPDDVWALANGIHDQLDDYNNGRLCENHMD